MKRLLPALLCGVVGCSSFSSPRSAVVRPGVDVAFQLSMSTPPGPEAGWFWSLDCACDHPVTALEASVTFARTEEGDTGSSYALGFAGTQLFLEGYRQLRGGARPPFGVGFRLGVPWYGWMEHRLFARYDVPLAEGLVLLVNPGLMVHHGNSPNGANPGSFLAFTQTLGLDFDAKRMRIVPGVGLVLGRTSRKSYGTERRSARTAFLVTSLSVVF